MALKAEESHQKLLPQIFKEKLDRHISHSILEQFFKTPKLDNKQMCDIFATQLKGVAWGWYMQNTAQRQRDGYGDWNWQELGKAFLSSAAFHFLPISTTIQPQSQLFPQYDATPQPRQRIQHSNPTSDQLE
ncbi:hypothetical protein Fcan01_28673 [Folsomia candida]|uniref:Retrotransposon gag domain-containing protein n=1 Tax=Folsomia candida TaxID=158441 RepID=A0A226CW14_FOLCA|nr:hypothetical protein Fcan01_28673 [Folsomia candida]